MNKKLLKIDPRIRYVFSLVSLSSITSIARADVASLGDLANNFMEPVNIVSDFVGTGSIIIGICSLFGALLRYLQYRKNPLMSPISTVIVLVIIGIALLLLPFIYKLTGTGVAYHLL